MGAYDIFRARITMAAGGVVGSVAEVEALPARTDLAISFAHEYVHYLQALSSICGFKIFGEFFEVGVLAALLASGKLRPGGGEVDPVELEALLPSVPDGYALTDSSIGHRAHELGRHVLELFSPACAGGVSVARPGGLTDWQVVTIPLRIAGEERMVACVASPHGRLVPITPGVLSEGMARQVDRLLSAQVDPTHSWGDGVVEQEHYRLIENVLRRDEYRQNVAERFVPQIAIVVCHLALASPIPDRATAEQLRWLRSGVQLGQLPQCVELELRDRLVREGLLHANYFNQVMDRMLHDNSSKVVSRMEFLSVYNHLRKVHQASNAVLASSEDFFGDPSWDDVVQWMHRFGVPPVLAMDGPVGNVAAIPVEAETGRLLAGLCRIVFGT